MKDEFIIPIAGQQAITTWGVGVVSSSSHPYDTVVVQYPSGSPRFARHNVELIPIGRLQQQLVAEGYRA